LKIGELARQAGLRASAIRYYEKVGLLSAPDRKGNQRRYAADAINRLLLIRFTSEMGFTLTEIRIFLSGLRSDAPVGPRWRKLAHGKIKQVDASIKRSQQLKSLLQHLLQCRCPSLPVCVQRLSLSPTLQSLPFPSAVGAAHVSPVRKHWESRP
jgi:MerR family transcriptional regulator, redox-sensitive transcriptional activator SoxR